MFSIHRNTGSLLLMCLWSNSNVWGKCIQCVSAAVYSQQIIRLPV